MVRSLRARLLLWFTVVMVITVAGFGALVAYAVWRARIADIDAALELRAELLVRSLRASADGTFDLALATTPAETGDDAMFYHAIWTSAGTPIDRSDEGRASAPPATPGVATRDGRREITRVTPAGAVVLAGRDLADVRGDLWGLTASMAAVGLVASAAAAIGGWLIAAGAVRPLRRIGETARAMTSGDFDARIPVDRIETELGQIALALNGAFDGLQAALARQRRFTADASHELRTPLATISTETQWTLARERSPDEYRQSIHAMQRAATRMQSIVERLLALARAEARADPPQVVRLDEITRAAVADVETLAARKGVTIHFTATPVSVSAPSEPLRESVTHILANAIQYTPGGGEAHVTVAQEGDSARLTVRDTGIGIAPADLPRVFEPFFRASTARTADGHGAGLGLAVAHAVVTGAGGTITCTSAPGAGTTVEIVLRGRA